MGPPQDGKASDSSLLSSPVSLPCGRSIPNRLVKVAMYEGLAPLFGGPPSELHDNVYKRWGAGGWGMIITGNVQVASDHLSLGRDITVPSTITPESLSPFRNLAEACHVTSDSSPTPSVAVLQLSHTGRQSPRIIGGRLPWNRPLSPSSVDMNSGEGVLAKLFYGIVFQKPRPMTAQDVEEVISAFVRGAQVAIESGFDGVQIHCSHGYLLAQFLSPKTNRRTDVYGPPNQMHLIKTIITRIRKLAPPTFILCLKVNAADYVSNDISHDDALDQIKEMASWGGIDLIEISGGSYERPDFMLDSSRRQQFFFLFSRAALLALDKDSPECPRIILTGSLRSRSLLATAIRENHAHLIGLGRPSIAFPNLPHLLLNPSLPELRAFPPLPSVPRLSAFFKIKVKLLGAGVDTAWWILLMGQIARGDKMDHSVGAIRALLSMWIWPTPGAVRGVGIICLVFALVSFMYFRNTFT